MNQNQLDHIDKTLKKKPAPIRRESKADRIMKKLFGPPEHESSWNAKISDCSHPLLDE